MDFHDATKGSRSLSDKIRYLFISSQFILSVIHDMFISTINSTNPDDIQNWIPSLINGIKLKIFSQNDEDVKKTFNDDVQNRTQRYKSYRNQR